MASIGALLQDHPSLDTRTYRVIEAFTPLCCETVMAVGDILEIRAEPSTNRLIILRAGGFHKVRRSTFHRCTEVIQE